MFDRILPPFHPHPVPPTLQLASRPPRKPQVKASTVYARGNTVGPYGGAIDILRFSAGPGKHDMADVRVTVRSTANRPDRRRPA
ncbi:hypothetical protein GCM10022207_14020 [Streptomyces lannensis]|uniref:Uncharacterized protein n=1 Tax=Streptomyces lannensis TaxID=766498 RepID=A0ABP7JRE4_9ACTN